MSKILIFGDSIAWGAFDYERGGWVERLKTKYLKTYETKNDFGVYNLSISSNDTRKLLSNLEKNIEIFNEIEPEEYIFLFSIGSNDPAYINTRDNGVVSLEDFEENINSIIKISKKFSSKIVFTGLAIIDEDKTKPWSSSGYCWENNDLKKYNDIIEKICNKNNIDFIPLWDLLDKNDLFDGMHPNSKGHEEIFNRIDKYFLEKIKVLTRK